MKLTLLNRNTLAIAVLSASMAYAQDAVKVAPTHYTVKTDNAHVRVVEGALAPGEKVTATATRSAGPQNTSEFSACVPE